MLNLFSCYQLLKLFVFCGVQRTLRNNHMYAEYILYFLALTPCASSKMFLRVFHSNNKIICINTKSWNNQNFLHLPIPDVKYKNPWNRCNKQKHYVYLDLTWFGIIYFMIFRITTYQTNIFINFMFENLVFNLPKLYILFSWMSRKTHT